MDIGEHYIDVRLYNQSVHDSPFTCNVGDPELVTVRHMPSVIRHTELGQAHNFESRFIRMLDYIRLKIKRNDEKSIKSCEIRLRGKKGIKRELPQILECVGAKNMGSVPTSLPGRGVKGETEKRRKKQRQLTKFRD